MKKIGRKKFLKQSSIIGAVSLNPFRITISEGQINTLLSGEDPEKPLMTRLVEANDRQVEILISGKLTSGSAYGGYRNFSANFASLSAAYYCDLSKYHKNPALIRPMEEIMTYLLKVQNPDGTLDSGNLQSPPDTAFMLEKLCKGANLLEKKQEKALEKVRNDVKIFITKAANTIAEGGVHTPNHRWAISGTLANVNAVYPDKKYVDRILDWLGEGIYIDNDGEYAERSKNYARVNNSAFIETGRLLNMPDLFEPVRKNLRMTYYQMEPNGDLITNNSRRQDQFSIQSIVGSYLFYRFMAIHDNNSEFAAVAKFIEGLKGFEESIINQSLINFMEEPLLLKELPPAAALPVNYVKIFPDSSLVHIRRENTTSTLFGGTDWPFIIASGRSHVPDFFAYRKGNAILRYMRFSTRFFSMGYFRSIGLKTDQGNYILYQKLEAPYYHPLPAEFRNPRGDYKLSPSIDDRFWSKMDFEHRPVTIKMLETTITLTENNGSNELTFKTTGSDNVAVTIELCFREGGKLTGVIPANDGENNYFLESGNAKYESGGDFIEFGPGSAAHKNIRGLEGEKYSTHSGTLRTPGMHVYITGNTPFEHKLRFF